MTVHDHCEFVEGCYRCELSRDEVEGCTTLEQWLYDTGIAMPGQVKAMAKRIEHSDWLAAHDAEKRVEWEAETQ